MTEQEQIELLKNWIKQYSLVIFTGVLMAIIAMSAWRFWDQRQSKIMDHASSVYDEMLTMRAQNETAEAAIQTKKLFSHYEKTTYGKIASLMMARTAAVNSNYPESKQHLQWVLEHTKIDALKQIARLRIARLMIAEGKPEASIDILQKINDKNFNGLIDEVRGDAYLAMNNTDKARAAYKLAISELPNADVIRPLLQMKYDNLTTTLP